MFKQKLKLWLLVLGLGMGNVCAQSQDTVVPFSTLFHQIGTHTLQSLSYNYGLNAAVGVAGTYALVHSGLDWKWHQLAQEHKALVIVGMPSVLLGGIIPLTVPAGMYIYGRNKRNYETQITGLALGQAALLGFGISSSIKAFTGRRPPEILRRRGESDAMVENEDFSKDLKFGFWRRGAFVGWPSGHTMTAFAMGSTLLHLYPESNAIKYSALAYAGIIGLGISVNIHWFSDFFAGALTGYAIGAVVGKSFKQLLDSPSQSSRWHWVVSPQSAQISYDF